MGCSLGDPRRHLHERGQATVHEMWVEQGDRIRVTVAQGDASLGEAHVYYTLGPGGTLASAEISREFRASTPRSSGAMPSTTRSGPGTTATCFP